MAEQRLLMPQEIEVLYILPAIRKEFAAAFKAFGADQRGIAKLLHVTEAAVSQYLSGKRAAKVDLGAEGRKMVREAARRVLDGKTSFLEESQRVASWAYESRLTCRVHARYGSAPRNCDACMRRGLH